MSEGGEQTLQDAESAGFWAISRTAMAIVGHDGRVRRTNPAWKALVGRLGDMVGEPLIDHVAEPDRLRLTNAMVEVRDALAADVRLRLLRGEGSSVAVSCELSAASGSDIFYCSARPVSVPLLHEGQPDLLSWLLRPLHETDIVGLCVISYELQRTIYANAAAGRIWEIPDLAERAEAGTMSFDELSERFAEVLLEPEIFDTIRTELQSNDGKREFEVLLRGDRSVLWLVVPAKDDNGRPIGALFVSRDVTGRRHTEARLEHALARVEQSEKEFRTLLDVMPDGISVMRNGVVTYVNDAALRVYGVERREHMVGVHVSAFVKPEDLADALERLERMTRMVEPARVEPFMRRDGSTGYLQTQGFPIESDGAPAVLTIAHDVTEQRLMEAKMRQAERLASLGMLSAAVAHEINNPLAYILLNLQATRRWLLGTVESEASSGASRTLEMIEQSLEGVEHVRTIVRDLSAFSHADDSGMELLDVRNVINSVIPMVEHKIQSRAKLVFRFDDVPFVSANASRLGQVFLNLLVNAAQAIPEGEVGHEIGVSASSDGADHVIVEVRDSGVGMSDLVRERIFEPFFTSKEPGVGTGLGLSLCLGIVNALGGEIHVESEVGKGSMFRVSLPVATGPQSTRQRPETLVLPRSKILVVDDEPRIANRLAELLQEHDVAIATNGTDAIARLEEAPFDAVFCDLMMPDVKGTDVFEVVTRAQPHLQDRFIFMTAGAFTPAARDLLDRVPNPRLDKPFNEMQVRHALSLVLATAPASVKE